MPMVLLGAAIIQVHYAFIQVANWQLERLLLSGSWDDSDLLATAVSASSTVDLLSDVNSVNPAQSGAARKYWYKEGKKRCAEQQNL
jgi:hypothetical protein